MQRNENKIPSSNLEVNWDKLSEQVKDCKNMKSLFMLAGVYGLTKSSSTLANYIQAWADDEGIPHENKISFEAIKAILEKADDLGKLKECWESTIKKGL